MDHSSLLLCAIVGALLIFSARASDWCYTGCESHTPSHWGDLPGSFCDGKRQSPINIDTRYVDKDSKLVAFNLINFTSNITSMINNGHTVKGTFGDNVEVSGGGLNGVYSVDQFHLHWGDTNGFPGSEHMLNGRRSPMEMHIVSLKKGLTADEAMAQSEGIAVLGFFVNATEDGDMTGSWNTLTSYLTDQIDTTVSIKDNLSIQDLIKNVNLTKFYRYLGSLTTPTCNEAVVWTVFHEPIKINKKLIERFPANTGLSNIYRPTQALNKRQVFASPASPLPPSYPWCYNDHCEHTSSNWPLLYHSHCDGESQSPINIETRNTVVDKNLDAFVFTKFDDKHAIKYITNTGHAVKCVLNDGVAEVSGGGLGHVYSTLQFHFHWGTESHDSHGSEHKVDSKQYPMEMHIVNKRKDLSLEEAVQTPNGLAVLGFFIEAVSTTKSSSSSSSSSADSGHADSGHAETSTPSDMEVWKKLTHYLSAIKTIDQQADVTDEISMNDLLGNVNMKAYYRYNGSLTTPTCDEAVVWTIFKESLKVNQSLMSLFPTEAGYRNVFRPLQSLHNRTVYSTVASAASGPAPAPAPAPAVLFLLPLLLLCTVSFNLRQ